MSVLNSAVATRPTPTHPMVPNRARTDREAFGRIVGHLHMAARTLLEGKITTIEKMRHEIRKILHTVDRKISEEAAFSGVGMPMSFIGPDQGIPELTLPSTLSVQAWNDAVDAMVPLLKKLPQGTTFPDSFKERLGKLIKEGGKLSGGQTAVAAHAREEIGEAVSQYRTMSGTSFL
jgi:hypothetical protein